MKLSERITRGATPEELDYADACERLAMAHKDVEFHYDQLEGCDGDEFAQVSKWYEAASEERDSALDDVWDTWPLIGEG